MAITRVRVPAKWDKPMTGRSQNVEHAVADFQLGPGPCGKTVERLDVHFHVHGVEIVQVCTCTEQKNFVYPWHTVTGREAAMALIKKDLDLPLSFKNFRD